MTRLLISTAILATTVFLSLTACRNPIDKDLYGTYEHNDSFNIIFSRITFYPDNAYSFYSGSCLTHNHDSGQFILDKDTLSFTSLNLPQLDSHVNFFQPLTKSKFVYKKGKVFYFNGADTIFWTKKP